MTAGHFSGHRLFENKVPPNDTNKLLSFQQLVVDPYPTKKPTKYTLGKTMSTIPLLLLVCWRQSVDLVIAKRDLPVFRQGWPKLDLIFRY